MSRMTLKPEISARDLETVPNNLFACSGDAAVCIAWLGLYIVMIVSVLLTGFNFETYLPQSIALIAIE